MDLKLKKMLLALFMVVLLACLLGCSSNESPDPAEPEASEQIAEPEKYVLSMGTGSSSGTYYYIGAGFCNMVSKYFPEIQITAQSTAAAFENARLVARSEMDFGLTCAGTLEYLKKDENLDLSNVAMIAVGNRSDAQWITLNNSKVKTFEDLKGKKVGVGPQGSATLMLMSMNTLEAGWGLKPEDYTPVYYDFGEIVRGLKEGTIDAGVIAAGFPLSSIMDLCSTNDVRFLEVSPEALQKIESAQPYLQGIVMPADTYDDLDKDVQIYTAYQRMICRKDLPEEVVYKFMQAVYEHPEERDQIHPQASLWSLENALNGAESDNIDFHPGAIKYFKEKGVWPE